MFKHAILALALVGFGFPGGAEAAAEHDCCCGKDAKCCQSTADHKGCGDDASTCGCCDHGGHGDPDARADRHA